MKKCLQYMEASIVPFLDESEKLKSALILTAVNPASAELEVRFRHGQLCVKSLKSGFHAFVPLKGHGGDKAGKSFMLFNIGVRLAPALAGWYRQQSYVYILPTEIGVEAQYWQTSDENSPYHVKRNPYCLRKSVVEVYRNTGDTGAFMRLLPKLGISFDRNLFEAVREAIHTEEGWFMLLDAVGMAGYAASIRANKDAVRLIPDEDDH